MFTPFFYKLKEYRVPVSLTEWMVLMEACEKGCINDLNDFYYLARAILVKSETHFDQYDQAFQDYFHGIETPVEIAEEILQWLQDPRNDLKLTPEELAQLRRSSRFSISCRTGPAAPANRSAAMFRRTAS